jgi:hypothetical protein
MDCISVQTSGERVRNNPQAVLGIETGTLMQKPIPPRLVEPYLTGRRTVIAGFVYRAAETPFTEPGDFYRALDLGYDGSEFRPDMSELYLLRWTSASPETYLVPYSRDRGGDWTGKPPFTGTGYTSWPSRPIPEFYVDLMPIPVGTEIYRISSAQAAFIARYDGQVWLRPAEGV